LAALVLGLLFPVSKHIADAEQRRKYYILQVITLLGAIFGAKVVVLIGDYNWPLVKLEGWQTVVFSGRSIVGGLIFGLLAAETAKPLLAYRLPPNDRFAALLPFTIAIGRVGCLLSGCCRGLPHEGPLSISYADGVPRYPTQAWEIAFHLSAGLVFVVLVRARRLSGHLFSVYMIAYGVFRFVTEFLRDTPKNYGPISAYQFFSLAMILIGTGFLIKRSIPSRQLKEGGGYESTA
jgi:phosphatidylglycerol:prolipoprotein diacylglycerol transferase